MPDWAANPTAEPRRFLIPNQGLGNSSRTTLQVEHFAPESVSQRFGNVRTHWPFSPGISRGIAARRCRCVLLIPSIWQDGKTKLAFALTDAVQRSVKPPATPFKLADGSGLYALINPNGSVLWRYNAASRLARASYFPARSLNSNLPKPSATSDSTGRSRKRERSDIISR